MVNQKPRQVESWEEWYNGWKRIIAWQNWSLNQLSEQNEWQIGQENESNDGNDQ